MMMGVSVVRILSTASSAGPGEAPQIFYDPSGHWSCMTTPAHVWSVSTDNIKLCTKYVP